MRPRRGQTNYLNPREDKASKDTFSILNASQGQDGLKADDAEDDVNPWNDDKAVDALKAKHQLSDEDIQEHRQRHAGITPDILGRALSDNMEDADIVEAIQQYQAQQMSERFDSNEAARSKAVKMQAQKQDSSGRPQGNRPLRPFPENNAFISQPVLSEELREIIYLKVVRDGLTVRTVSTLMGVSMERVGAVVRMKQMERDWVKDGKPLAVPYSRAVLDMLPTTPFLDTSLPANREKKQPVHEPINELPVHPSTTHQTFVSVPESRQFTRADAAKAFSPHLKSSDERIPHPELLEIERYKNKGKNSAQVAEFARQIVEREKEQLRKKAVAEAKKAKDNTSVYKGGRWNFVFQDVSVEDAGANGRGKNGTGWRYGMPHEDRKRGQVKIPTRM